jgi:hypothetical protein
MGGRIREAEKEIKIDRGRQSREKQAKLMGRKSSNNKGRLQDIEARTSL